MRLSYYCWSKQSFQYDPLSNEEYDAQNGTLSDNKTNQELEQGVKQSDQLIPTHEAINDNQQISPITYRPDIDGIRTIAVTIVVLFHAYRDYFPSGFIGVDIFFVISGYLISGIIFKQHKKGNFTYTNFYSRRIRRIFPSLILVLTATIIMGCFCLWSIELKAMATTLMAGTIFGANIQVLLLERGYFDADIAKNSLLHLWSLGVEEQFYIVWPFLAMFIIHSSKHVAALILTLLTSFSFSLNVYYVTNAPKMSYYFPFCRFWQMAIGSILAYIALEMPPQLTKQQSLRISTTGIMLISLGLLFINENSAFPGWWAIFPSLGAACLIFAGPETPFNKYILGSGPFVFVGKVSYPLYLWHYPLLVYARQLYPDENNKPMWAKPYMMLVYALILSIVTYYIVEGRVRHLKSKFVVPVLSGLMVVMFLTSILIMGNPITFSRNSSQSMEVVIPDFQDTLDLSLPIDTAGSNLETRVPAVTSFVKDEIEIAATSKAKTAVTPKVEIATTSKVEIAATSKVEIATTSKVEITSSNPPQTSISNSIPAQSIPNSSKVTTLPRRPVLNSSRHPKIEPATVAKVKAGVQNWDYPPKVYTGIPATSKFASAYGGYVLNEGQNNSIVVIGDSHANMISHRFVKLFEDAKAALKKFPTIVYKTINGTPSLPCHPAFAVNMKLVKKTRPKALLVVTNWPQFLRPGGLATEAAHTGASLRCCVAGYTDKCAYQNPNDVNEIVRQFYSEMQELHDLGIKVFVATINPEGSAYNPLQMLGVSGLIEANMKAVSLKAFRSEHAVLLKKIEDGAVKANATIIDFAVNICWNDVCEVIEPHGNPIMKDKDHFRPFFARQYVDSVDQVVEAALQ